MRHKVHILPSGHIFRIETMESILHAGLRAGLNLDHHCANGNCGECRARLISGGLEQIRMHDYRFSPQERAAGWFLMCCQRAVTDLVLETHEVGNAAEISVQQVPARIGRVERLQDDVIEFSVRTPRSRGLQFLAGQEVQLQFDGLPARRLAIASCPCDAIQLRFHVRRTGDPFSAWLFGHLKKGTEVLLSGPHGNFVLDEDSTRPLVFVAADTGFAPVASLIDHVIQRDAEREIHLYWLSALTRGHYLANQCRAWQDALDHFHYHPIELAPAGRETIASVCETLLDTHAPAAGWDFYLSLPGAAMNQIAGHLREHGGMAGQIHLRDEG